MSIPNDADNALRNTPPLTAEQQQQCIDLLFAWFMYDESDPEPSPYAKTAALLEWLFFAHIWTRR